MKVHLIGEGEGRGGLGGGNLGVFVLSLTQYSLLFSSYLQDHRSPGYTYLAKYLTHLAKLMSLFGAHSCDTVR